MLHFELHSRTFVQYFFSVSDVDQVFVIYCWNASVEEWKISILLIAVFRCSMADWFFVGHTGELYNSDTARHTRKPPSAGSKSHYGFYPAIWAEPKRWRSPDGFTVLTCVSHTAHVIDVSWTSVCLSVCPSNVAGIVSKRLNLSSNCLHCLVAPWF